MKKMPIGIIVSMEQTATKNLKFKIPSLNFRHWRWTENTKETNWCTVPNKKLFCSTLFPLSLNYVTNKICDIIDKNGKNIQKLLRSNVKFEHIFKSLFNGNISPSVQFLHLSFSCLSIIPSTSEINGSQSSHH